MEALWDGVQKYVLFALEGELVVVFTLVFIILGRRGLRPLERLVRRAAGARRPILVVGAAALALHVAIIPALDRPAPGIHDEFSYLLMADTFLHGRLANPTHPLWVHFESYHINQKPTYASMYPPGQGIVLALGQLFGHPVIGVWLSAVIMCCAVCWMLQGWLPPYWALIGSLLVVARLAVFSYWANTYWGGALAAIGGALLWGALPRLRSRPSARDACLLVLGGLILFNTRPFEGFLVCVPAGIAVLVWSVRALKASAARPAISVFAPAACLLVLGLTADAIYNWRVFGNPLKLPYQVNRETYAAAQHFIWQPPLEPKSYTHPVMRRFYTGWELQGYQSKRDFDAFVELTLNKLRTAWCFYIGPGLTLPLVIGLIAGWRSRFKWPLLALGTLTVGETLLAWPTNPHYTAPAVGCLYLIILVGLRVIAAWHRNQVFSGRAAAMGTLLACMTMLLFRASAPILNVPQVNNVTPVPWYAAELFPNLNRDRIVRDLQKMGGKHLVIVRYGPEHFPIEEYVYNRADIDGSDIVWARELTTPDANLPLLEYFKDRHIWLLNADTRPPMFLPYIQSSMRSP